MVAALQFGPAAVIAAFAAGFVSFASPCVLPLVPGYLSFASGVGFDELGGRPRRVTGMTAVFVAGFTTMFVLLGAGVSWLGNGLLVHRRSLEIVAGCFIALAGLVYAGVPLPRVLLVERRFHLGPRRQSPITAFAAGVAFAVGWTPCIGPTLAAILAIAANHDSGQGAVLLAIYALGLGVPFLLFGLAFTRTLGLARALRRRWRIVSLTSGGALIASGILLATGELTRLATQLSGFTGWQI